MWFFWGENWPRLTIRGQIRFVTDQGQDRFVACLSTEGPSDSRAIPTASETKETPGSGFVIRKNSGEKSPHLAGFIQKKTIKGGQGGCFFCFLLLDVAKSFRARIFWVGVANFRKGWFRKSKKKPEPLSALTSDTQLLTNQGIVGCTPTYPYGKSLKISHSGYLMVFMGYIIPKNPKVEHNKYPWVHERCTRRVGPRPLEGRLPGDVIHNDSCRGISNVTRDEATESFLRR